MDQRIKRAGIYPKVKQKIIGGTKMKNTVKYLFFLLPILLFLNGCSLNKSVNDDLFQYKGSFIGDNSAVGNIVGNLPNGKYVDGFELKTKEEPYGVVLEYGDLEATMIDDTIKETVIYNSTFIFALVNNADWVTFDYGDRTLTVKREELQEWYGKDLRELTNEEELRKLIQEYSKDERKVFQFFDR